MASSIVLGRLAASSAAKLFDPARSGSLIPSVSRFFNTNAQMPSHSDDDRSSDVDRRFCRFAFLGFPVVLDPFYRTRSLSHVRNLMDGTMEDPYLAASRGVGAGTMRGLDVKDSKDALYLRVDMPGLCKNDVKLTVEQNTLIIKGEAAKESEEGEGNLRRFSKRIELPENDFQLDMIKAEMKNGVLKVTVPKVKDEERKDVWQVTVE